MRPDDKRLGRKLAGGRFETVEWLGTAEWMGVIRARDLQTSRLVRVTVAGRSALAPETLSERFMRPVRGLSNVVYVGEVASDDGWAPDGLAFVEEWPAGRMLSETPAPSVARLGAQLVEVLAAAHREAEPLATLRPESIHVDDDGTLTGVAARGERMWLTARPLSVGLIPPWPPGYVAPEVLLVHPFVEVAAPAADVFSLGVILAERLLGRFPFPRDSYTGMLQAQWEVRHLEMPATPLGELLTRALNPEPAARPSLAELSALLA